MNISSIDHNKITRPAHHHPIRSAPWSSCLIPPVPESTPKNRTRPPMPQIKDERVVRSQRPIECTTPGDSLGSRGASHHDSNSLLASHRPDDIEKREHPPQTSDAQRDDDKENNRKKPQGYYNLIQCVHFNTPFSKNALLLLIICPEVIHEQAPSGPP